MQIRPGDQYATAAIRNVTSYIQRRRVMAFVPSKPGRRSSGATRGMGKFIAVRGTRTVGKTANIILWYFPKLKLTMLVNEVNLIRYTSLTNHQYRTSTKVNSNHQDLNPKKTVDINRYIQQAYTCFSQGDIEGAMANFQNGISLYPHCVQLYTERANFRQHQLKDLTGALEDYTQAIDINPHNALCYFWRSQTYQALGNHQKAIEDHNTAMSLAPEGTIYHCFEQSTYR